MAVTSGPDSRQAGTPGSQMPYRSPSNRTRTECGWPANVTYVMKCPNKLRQEMFRLKVMTAAVRRFGNYASVYQRPAAPPSASAAITTARYAQSQYRRSIYTNGSCRQNNATAERFRNGNVVKNTGRVGLANKYISGITYQVACRKGVSINTGTLESTTKRLGSLLPVNGHGQACCAGECQNVPPTLPLPGSKFLAPYSR